MTSVGYTKAPSPAGPAVARLKYHGPSLIMMRSPEAVTIYSYIVPYASEYLNCTSSRRSRFFLLRNILRVMVLITWSSSPAAHTVTPVILTPLAARAQYGSLSATCSEPAACGRLQHQHRSPTSR